MRFTKVIVGRVAVGATGLVLFAYLVLVVINWSDQAPTETVIQFSTLYENRPIAADTNNAHTYMLGFSAPPNADPYELGQRRRAWIESTFASPGLAIGPDPLNEPYDYRSERSPGVVDLARACNREFFMGCIEALIESESVVSQWLIGEEWLLDRYGGMVAFTGYHETPFDHSLPLPPYSDISDIRRLLFIRAWAAGESGDAELVESLLDQDLVFWRMVVANSDTLLTKMIAVDAVASHFGMANRIVRHLQGGGLNVRMPSSWRVEVSDAERSMQRSLIGEWVLIERTLIRSFDDMKLADLGAWDFVFWKAVSPFWQPQDESNRYADGMRHYIDLFAAPYASVPDALGLTGYFDPIAALSDSIPRAASGEPQDPAFFNRPLNRAYNLTGGLLMPNAFPDMSFYGARVADLEGIRRAAVATWQLRSEDVDTGDVEARLRDRQWSNPYTDAPLEWDSSANEIVFQGLRSRDRGRYAFPY